MAEGSARVAVRKVRGDRARSRAQLDSLAVEEPLEIRLAWPKRDRETARPIAITMRTPGHDRELALGFLLSEGLITTRKDVAACVQTTANVVRVDLASGVRVDLEALERHFYISSSCGVCGKASIDAVRVRRAVGTAALATPQLRACVVHALPDRLRLAQSVFEATGGLHAAGLFDAAGALVAVREDVGRHNAVDKLVGWAFLEGCLPLHDRVLLLSGRASFELLQKAAMAGVAVVAAVGAPSSLAVEMAQEAGITLLGFVRDDSFNIYSCHDRIIATEGGENHG